MTERILLLIVLWTLSTVLNAQTSIITENEKDIYWQPSTKIDFSDYQSQSDSDCIKYHEKYGVNTSSSIGFRGVVDIPNRKGKADKFYIAPVFCKNCSCLLAKDSMGLKVDNLMFDMAEVCARGARKELLELQAKMNADDTYSMFFTSISNSWEERLRSFFGTVIREVLVEKKDSAYISWKETVDKLLQQTESFATKPEDCYRFILNKPLEKNYKMAEKIMGDLRNKSKNE
jgi:hypothetical protein